MLIDFLPDQLEAVPSLGDPDDSPRVAIVGSAPGLNRGHSTVNEPFGPSSMALIDKIRRAADEPVYLTNLVKTRQSSKKKVPIRSVRRDYPALVEELKFVGVKRALVLGTEAATALCPGFKNMREDHGTMFFNPELQMFVVPTWPFSSIAKDAENLDQIVHDAQRVFTLPDPVKPDYEVLKTSRELRDVLNSWVGAYVFADIETTGLAFTDDFIELGFCDKKSNKAYIVRDLKLVREFIVQCSLHEFEIVGQNFQFDLSRIVHWTDSPEWFPVIHDTMVTAHVLGERNLSLKHLTTTYTTRPGSRAYGGPGDPEYLAEDVLSTRELWLHYQKVMAESGETPWILDRLNAKVATVANMQRRGVYIDRKFLKSLLKDMTAKRDLALSRLNDKFGTEINWNAGQQIAGALIAAGVRLREKTETGQWKTDEATLQALVDKGEFEVGLILSYREAVKELEFVESYLALSTDDDPYLRPRLKLTGTETGRLSCSDPNLQQVPREGPIKLAFRSRWRRGKIGLVDLSQAELRVVALLSGDEVLMQALLAEDVHLDIASRIFRKPPEEITALERKKSKGVTFGLLYGGSDTGLAARVGVPVDEVQKIIKLFFGVFKKLAAWIKRETAIAVKTGKSTTLFGRVRDMVQLMRREGRKSVARKASNTPVQSVASDCDLLILGAVDDWLKDRGYRTRPVLGVHDSIVFDIYPGEEDILIEAASAGFARLSETPLSRSPLWRDLPLVGELVFGDSWAEVESTNVNYNPQRKHPLSTHTPVAA